MHATSRTTRVLRLLKYMYLQMDSSARLASSDRLSLLRSKLVHRQPAPPSDVKKKVIFARSARPSSNDAPAVSPAFYDDDDIDNSDDEAVAEGASDDENIRDDNLGSSGDGDDDDEIAESVKSSSTDSQENSTTGAAEPNGLKFVTLEALLNRQPGLRLFGGQTRHPSPPLLPLLPPNTTESAAEVSRMGRDDAGVEHTVSRFSVSQSEPSPAGFEGSLHPALTSSSVFDSFITRAESVVMHTDVRSATEAVAPAATVVAAATRPLSPVTAIEEAISPPAAANIISADAVITTNRVSDSRISAPTLASEPSASVAASSSAAAQPVLSPVRPTSALPVSRLQPPTAAAPHHRSPPSRSTRQSPAGALPVALAAEAERCAAAEARAAAAEADVQDLRRKLKLAQTSLALAQRVAAEAKSAVVMAASQSGSHLLFKRLNGELEDKTRLQKPRLQAAQAASASSKQQQPDTTLYPEPRAGGPPLCATIAEAMAVARGDGFAAYVPLAVVAAMQRDTVALEKQLSKLRVQLQASSSDVATSIVTAGAVAAVDAHVAESTSSSRREGDRLPHVADAKAVPVPPLSSTMPTSSSSMRVASGHPRDRVAHPTITSVSAAATAHTLRGVAAQTENSAGAWRAMQRRVAELEAQLAAARNDATREGGKRSIVPQRGGSDARAAVSTRAGSAPSAVIAAVTVASAPSVAARDGGGGKGYRPSSAPQTSTEPLPSPTVDYQALLEAANDATEKLRVEGANREAALRGQLRALHLDLERTQSALSQQLKASVEAKRKSKPQSSARKGVKKQGPKKPNARRAMSAPPSSTRAFSAATARTSSVRSASRPVIPSGGHLVSRQSPSAAAAVSSGRVPLTRRTGGLSSSAQPTSFDHNDASSWRTQILSRPASATISGNTSQNTASAAQKGETVSAAASTSLSGPTTAPTVSISPPVPATHLSVEAISKLSIQQQPLLDAATQVEPDFIPFASINSRSLGSSRPAAATALPSSGTGDVTTMTALISAVDAVDSRIALREQQLRMAAAELELRSESTLTSLRSEYEAVIRVKDYALNEAREELKFMAAALAEYSSGM